MTQETDSGAKPPDLGFELPPPPKVSGKRLVIVAVGLLACVGLAFLAGYLPRKAAERRLDNQARSAQIPEVEVVTPKALARQVTVVLPGSIQPLAQTTLYPQASGYIKRFLVDIGNHVKEGELLAEIETPALDQEIDQARAALVESEATLGQAEANRDYANTSLQRYAVLRPSGVASQQELDQWKSQAQVSQANVGAARASIGVQGANLRRLLRLRDFARVVAPFTGIITTRGIDVGSLVSTGNSTPLYTLVATDPVRVFIDVPQNVAPSVKVGATATIALREYAGKEFKGIIAHTAGALDPATRTLSTEVRVPNPNNELLTGMYTDVTLSLDTPQSVYEVPGTALYNDSRGLRLAVVNADDRIHFVPIIIGRDLGATLQVASGLRGDERVIRLASTAWHEGGKVRVRQGRAAQPGPPQP